MDRIGPLDRLPVTDGWNHEYEGGPVFFESKGGLSFDTAGSDLYYAAAMLFKLSGQEEPLTWAKRLAHRYVETRDPKTGISGYVYTMERNAPKHPLADDFKEHVVHEGTIFCELGCGDPIVRRYFLHTFVFSPGVVGNIGLAPWMCQLLIGEMLDQDGKEFRQWALEELTARGNVAYRKENSSWIPMLTDGTSLQGYTIKRDIVAFGLRGNVLKAWPAEPTDFWAYALAYRLTGNKFIWEMTRSIATGNGFGDIGARPKRGPSLRLGTGCSNAHALLGFLALYEKTRQKAFLDMAERIGHNILRTKFHKGFFVPSDKHIYAKFDAIEALVLLHLYVTLRPHSPKLPLVWPARPRFGGPYRDKDKAYDNTLIYTLTESDEPRVSLNEAAANGDLNLVKSLIAQGADVNNRENGSFRTPLHLAAENGHVDVVAELLAGGADVTALGSDRTALQWAEQKGHAEIVELLRKHMLPHDVAIIKVSVPAKCIQGDTVPVTVSVANQEVRREAFRVILTNETGDKEIAKKDVTLARGWKDGSEDVADLILTGENIDDYFGQLVRIGGDANGDGYNDLLITADGHNNGQGKAYLYFGRKDGLKEKTDKIFTGEGSKDYFGSVGCIFGDVNGDGFDDVIVGAPGYSGGANDGRVYIYHGGPNMDEMADIILDGPVGEEGYFGLMAASGDINNDGHDDLLVTACALESWKGQAYLYYGGNPMNTKAVQTFEGEHSGDWFGRHAVIGDVDGDSCADILIGARNYRQNDKTGRAYLFFGSTTIPMEATCDLMFTGETTVNYMGTGLAIFDIDHDGFGDVLIGACRYHPTYIGRSYLYWGSSRADFDNVADKIFDGEPGSGNAYFGSDSGVGYVNDDEYGDILISAYLYPNGRKSGRAYLYHGGTKASMDVICDQTFTGSDPNSRYGVEAELGDLNNDGFADVAIGGWSYNDDHGRVWLWYGPFESFAEMKFNWDTTTATPGKHTLRATIAPVEGEEDTTNNTMTVEVEVKVAERR
jgi:hypothetical protein